MQPMNNALQAQNCQLEHKFKGAIFKNFPVLVTFCTEQHFTKQRSKKGLSLVYNGSLKMFSLVYVVHKCKDEQQITSCSSLHISNTSHWCY